jgi:hypothetical protein
VFLPLALGLPTPAHRPDIVKQLPRLPESVNDEKPLCIISAESPSLVGEDWKSLLNPVQDHLVALYFIHVHAMFPFLDEYSFTTTYKKYQGTEEIAQHIPTILLRAVTFAGLAVVILHQSISKKQLF